jgi:hypothetical protein
VSKTETAALVAFLLVALLWLALGVAAAVWTVREPGAILLLGMWGLVSWCAWDEVSRRGF